MSEDPRPFQIGDPISYDDRWITFAATDSTGAFRIRVGRLAWERLQAEAPYTFDACYARDYAVGMIEWQAAGRAVADTQDGRVLTLR